MINLPIDYDYLFKLKEHYGNGVTENKDGIIAELQATMQKELDTNYLNEFNLKFGMPEFTREAIINFDDSNKILVVLKDKKFKDMIYDSMAEVMLTEPNKCSAGDYVQLTKRDQEEVYIIRALPIEKKDHDEVMLLQCQHNIKILDDDGVKIWNFPCFFQDNKSRPSISERAETGVTEDSTFQAYVRYDEISRRFVDTTNGSNKITRILIDGLAYKIVGSDPASMKGLLTLGLELDTKSPNDNLELGIADYYNNIAPPTPEPTLQIIGDSELCIGDTNTYTITTNNVVTWGITNNGVNVTLGLTGVNGECTVYAKYDTKLIGKTETLTAYLDYGATFTKTITITSLI